MRGTATPAGVPSTVPLPWKVARAMEMFLPSFFTFWKSSALMTPKPELALNLLSVTETICQSFLVVFQICRRMPTRGSEETGLAVLFAAPVSLAAGGWFLGK